MEVARLRDKCSSELYESHFTRIDVCNLHFTRIDVCNLYFTRIDVCNFFFMRISVILHFPRKGLTVNQSLQTPNSTLIQRLSGKRNEITKNLSARNGIRQSLMNHCRENVQFPSNPTFSTRSKKSFT